MPMHFRFIATSGPHYSKIKQALPSFDRPEGVTADIASGLLTRGHLDDIDAVVCPGNSFGHMTGGFDGAVVQIVGQHVDDLVRARINQSFGGELNVGAATLIRAGSSTQFPKDMMVVYAPTMRTPQQLPVGTDIPYLATRAALTEILRYNASTKTTKLQRIMIPLMGVGTGGVPADVAIKQILMGIESMLRPRRVKALFGDGQQTDARLTNIWKDSNYTPRS